MLVLGLIPARGGSKGIPRKNLAPLTGKPLIAYTFESALQSRRLTRLMLSTDDEEIAALGKQEGIAAPFLRPVSLAADDTKMRDVVLHALDWLWEKEQYQPDAVVILQPTSPLRQSKHIDTAIMFLEDTGADTVVSVTQVPHQYAPGSLMRLEGDKLLPTIETQTLHRQSKPRLYARNGPAVLVIRTEAIRRGGFYDGDVRALIMDREHSVDIDTASDLAYAEFLLRQRVNT